MEAEAISDLSGLYTAVRKTLGLRLEDYRGRQLERRLVFFRQRLGLSGNAELAQRLYVDVGLRQQFADFVTINVSEFFRNPERFAELRHRYLPALLRHRPSLRIWSAGCSIGAEPYSVAIMLQELTPGVGHEILGTDIDAGSLTRCRAGVYQEADIRDVPPDLKRRYFRTTPEGWELSPAIRSQVQFRRLDLLSDPFPTDLDLILCRNVVIYFTDAAKHQLYRGFQASLRPGGLLFTGATESIFDAGRLGLQYLTPCFYQRAQAGGSAA